MNEKNKIKNFRDVTSKCNKIPIQINKKSLGMKTRNKDDGFQDGYNNFIYFYAVICMIIVRYLK